MASAHQVNLIKGTDPRSADYRLVQIEVNPDDPNNLLKRTSFGIKPYPKSTRRVQHLHEERFIGILAEEHLTEMRESLEKHFLNEGA